MKIAGLDLSIQSSGIVIETLNDNLEVIDVEHHAFTSVKKLTNDTIYHYNKKDYSHPYELYLFFSNKILSLCEDCEYIAIEDYAYAAQGKIFNLAEFEGYVKLNLFNKNKKLRKYSVNSIKKFFSGYGLSDKIGMKEAFDKYNFIKPDLSYLPEVKSGKGVSPTSDIIDAFAVCEFLRKELRLRKGIDTLHEQEEYIIECFNTITKENPKGLLVADFIKKGGV